MRGFLVLVLVAVDKGEDVEHRRDVRVVVTGSFLEVFEGLFTQGHSHFVTPLGSVLYHQVVQCAKAGWDFVACVDLGGELVRRCR